MPEAKKKGRPPKPKEAENVDDVVKDVVLRGRGGINNFSNNMKELVKTELQRETAKRLLDETLSAYKMPKVNNDQELMQRIQDYFATCSEKGQIPTVEEMCLSTGYAQSTIWDWETGRRGGFSPDTAEIIKKAKDFMQTFDAKLVVSGQLNFLTYCFRAKNYYNMVEKSEVVLTPNNLLGSDADPTTMAQKYREQLPPATIDSSGKE
jgi:polyhydroxyalkanoate synthesis regulator phasin